MSNGKFDNLKVGDTVGVRTGWVSTGWHIGIPVIKPETVEKVTVREVTVKGLRFLHSNGAKVGGDYYNKLDPRIEGLWTPELEAEANKHLDRILEYKRRQQLMTIIRATRFEDLPVDQLEAIVAILQAEKPVEINQ